MINIENSNIHLVPIKNIRTAWREPVFSEGETLHAIYDLGNAYLAKAVGSEDTPQLLMKSECRILTKDEQRKKLFDFSLGDIDWKLAHDAHRWTAMIASPDTRANQVQGGYLEFMESVNDEFNDWVTEENAIGMKSDLNYFRKGYIQRKHAQLVAQSRTASSAVTGPSNFPTKSNQKRLDTEHKRMTELLDWSEKTLNKLRSKYNPRVTNVIRSDDSDAIQKLEKKLYQLTKNHELMKSANKICRNKKISNDAKIEKLTELGIPEAKELLEPHMFTGKAGFTPFQLTNNSATIKSTRERLEQLKKETARPEAEEITGNGWLLRENKEVKRIQFVFDGKPTKEIRKALAKSAFKFARSWDDKPWQRMLNNNGRYAAKQIIKFLNEQERILEDD